jgi:hypothetical protein
MMYEVVDHSRNTVIYSLVCHQSKSTHLANQGKGIVEKDICHIDSQNKTWQPMMRDLCSNIKDTILTVGGPINYSLMIGKRRPPSRGYDAHTITTVRASPRCLCKGARNLVSTPPLYTLVYPSPLSLLYYGHPKCEG